MLISRLKAIFNRKVSPPPTSPFQEMRDALKPDKVRPTPPKPSSATLVQRRT
jgi:hypothetical protein